jgi:WD40 repeat protein/Flp pilus assembly protein TadD
MIRISATQVVCLALGGALLVAPATLAARQAGKADQRRPETLERAGVSQRDQRSDPSGDGLPPGARMRLGTVRHRQSASIQHVAYSADGKWIVTDGDDGQIRVWDAADGRLLRSIAADAGAISDFAIKSDSKTAMVIGVAVDAGAGIVRRVSFLDLTTGKKLAGSSWRRDDPVQHVALCADRSLVATLTFGGTVQLWDAANVAELWKIELGRHVSQRIAISPTGRFLLVVRSSDPQNAIGLKCEAIVYDIGLKRELRRITEQSPLVNDCTFSPDGTKIVLATFDLVIWDFEKGNQDRLTKLFIRKLAFSPGGRYLLGVGVDQHLTVWDSASLRQTGWFRAKLGREDAVAIAPDGQTIASTGGSTVLHCWDVPTQKDRLAVAAAHTDAINSLLFAGDGKMLVSASDDETARLWDVETGRQTRVMEHVGEVSVMALAPDGKRLLTGVEHHPWVYVWDLEKNGKPTIFSDGLLGASPLAVRLCDNGQIVAMFDRYGGVHRWDVKRQMIKETIPPRLRSAPDGGGLAEADAPEDFKRILNATPPMPIHADFFEQAAFLADGRQAAASAIGGLQVTELASGKKLHVHPDVKLFAVAPDERTLAVARGDPIHEFELFSRMSERRAAAGGNISLVDGATGKRIREFSVPGGEVWALAFDQRGKRIAVTSGWEAGRIHLFDVTSGNELGTIAAPPIRSSALAFSPDGSLLATGMMDSSILVFDVQSAVAGFNTAAELYPQKPRAPFRHRPSEARGNGDDQAIAHSDEMIKRDPKNPFWYDSRGWAWMDKKNFDKALADFNEAIRLDPKSANFHGARGWAWMNKKDFDKALADFDEQIRLEPNEALGYGNRGWAWMDKKDLERALADFDTAIRLEPENAVAYNNRSQLWVRKKSFDKALADLGESIRLDPKSSFAFNNQAWLWATCADGRYRDGARAVDSATRACELTEWKEATNVDTLAAACAERGDFDRAVHWQVEAIKLLPDGDQKKKSEERLRLYKEKKPYRATE